eukprot:403361957
MIKHQRSRKINQGYQKALVEIKNMSRIVSLIACQIDQYPQVVELTSLKYPEFNFQQYQQSFSSSQRRIQENDKGIFTSEINQLNSQQSLANLIESKFKILAPYVPAQCFTLAMYYIDKVTKRNQLFMIHSKNALRVATVSLMIAFKYYCETEELLRNSDFSKLISIESVQLLNMELSFFEMLDLKAYVTNNEFIAYKKQVQQLLQSQNPQKQQQDCFTPKSNTSKSSNIKKVPSMHSMQSNDSHDTTISEKIIQDEDILYLDYLSDEELHEDYTFGLIKDQLLIKSEQSVDIKSDKALKRKTKLKTKKLSFLTSLAHANMNSANTQNTTDDESETSDQGEILDYLENLDLVSSSQQLY